MKRLAIAGIVVAVLAVGLLMLAPRLIPTDIARDRIAQQITEWTGHPVYFDGDPVIALDSALSITLANVRIGDGRDGEPLIEMDALRGTVRLLPLLIGRVEIQEFELIRPRIALTVDGDGVANFGRLGGEIGGRLSEAERRARSGDSPETALGDLRLGRFVISNGKVTYRNQQAGLRTEFDDINLEIGWRRTSDAATARGSFRWSGETVEVNGSLGSPMDLFSGGASSVRIVVGSQPARLSFSGSAYRLGEYQLRGDLTIATPSVRRVVNWAGTPMSEGATLGAGSISGTANLAGSILSFSDAKFELDGNVGVGVISADLGREEPLIQGTLDFETLDLTAYLEAARAGILQAGRWTNVRLGLPALTGARLDLRLSAGTVLAGPARFTDAGATAMLGNGKVSVNLADARYHGGVLQATLNATVENGAVTASARAGLDGAEAGRALGELFGLDAVSGTGSFSAEATTGGSTWGALVADLTGTVRATIENGSVDGFEIGAVVAALTLPDFGGPIVSNRDTDFDVADIRLLIADGQVRTERFNVEGNGFRLRLQGWASLYQPTIAGIATLILGEDADRALSLMISGSWPAPRIEADPRPVRYLRSLPQEPEPALDPALQ